MSACHCPVGWPFDACCKSSLLLITLLLGDFPIQWCHNECYGLISPASRLFAQPFVQTSTKTPKLCITGLCEGKSLVTGELPAQRVSNAEIVCIWRRHHVRTNGSCGNNQARVIRRGQATEAEPNSRHFVDDISYVFSPKPHNKHPEARPWRDMASFLLWVQSVTHVLLLPLQYCIWSHYILDHVITVPGCIAIEVSCILKIQPILYY